MPDEQVVEVDEFEGDGTEVVGIHEGLPPGVSVVDNETGWRMALSKRAARVEREQ